MKRKKSTFIIYMIILVLFLFFPWVPVGNKDCNLIQFMLVLKEKGLDLLASERGITDLLPQLRPLLKIQIPLMLLQSVAVTITVVCALVGWKCHVKYANVLISPVNAFLQYSGYSVTSFGNMTILSLVIPSVIAILAVLEIPITIFIENWASAKEEWKQYQQTDRQQKEEQKERLKFEGKYTSQMYKVILKNFIRNWKDYILVIVFSIIVFVCFVVGYGMQHALKEGYEQRGTWIFNSMDEIVMNAFSPISILCIFIMILLITYNIKCRTNSYGIFLTLGMRKNTLYKFIVVEYLSIIIISLLVGGILGSVILNIIMMNLTIMETSMIGSLDVILLSCLKALGTLSGIIVVSTLVCFDMLGDFKAGKATDQRLIGEKLPNKFRMIFAGIGMVLVVYTTIQYGRRINYQNISLLLLLFVGLFVALRYLVAQILICEKKKRRKLHKLLSHSQLFHKSRTNIIFMGIMLVMLFVVLYYFSFQFASTNLASTQTELFPYDAVCLTNEEDDEFFDQLVQDYGVDIIDVPALRVTAYDSTKEKEGTSRPIQGQHIGISESTYHALKKGLNPLYEKKSLGLTHDEDIYIIYQQDKSKVAHPIGYFSPKKTPLLHIGPPCRGVDIYSKLTKYYNYYNVKGEEIGSLIGAFSHGERENIIVFSDEYFEKAKNFWKDCDVLSGIKIKDPDMAIPGVTTYQSITKMLLIQIPESSMSNVEEALDEFVQKKTEQEKELFVNYVGTPMQGIYDMSVSYGYLKNREDGNLQREHIMEITVNTIVIIVMGVMVIMLLLVKIMTEFDTNKERAKFLFCMGMRKKARVKLVKKEIYCYFYSLPLIGAIFLSSIYTIMIWKARMYTKTDIQFFISELLPVWIIFIVALTLIIVMTVNIYVYKVEKVNSRYNTL